MTRLALRGIACLRGGRLLFEDIGVALNPGDAALVTGPNGAGKSSLLRIAAGLLAPHSGTVAADGRCALLAESSALDPELPLADALRFWARIDDRPDGVAAALEATKLTQVAAVPVRLLSTGQRRRAGMARILAADAPIWLLDEPANGLDAAAVSILEGLVAAHRAGGGVALVATHLALALPGAAEIRL